MYRTFSSPARREGDDYFGRVSVAKFHISLADRCLTWLTWPSFLLVFLSRIFKYGAYMGLDFAGNVVFLTMMWSRRFQLYDWVITIERTALTLRPPGHPKRFIPLQKLAMILEMRGTMTLQVHDVEESVQLASTALESVPLDHPQHWMHIQTLSRCLGKLAYQLSERSDLMKESIRLNREALEHPSLPERIRPWLLNDLASGLTTSFLVSLHLPHLDEAMEIWSSVMAQYPERHIAHIMSLGGLAQSSEIRFRHTGAASDLEQALDRTRAAIAITPSGAPNRLDLVSSFGTLYAFRFQQGGQIEDLDVAIKLQSEVLAQAQIDITRINAIYGLTRGLQARFRHTHKMMDLEDAIQLLLDAVKVEMPLRARSFLTIHLAITLRDRFRFSHDLEDLEESIQYLRDMVNLLPNGDIERPRALLHLAVSFYSRFEATRDLPDVEQSIIHAREALEILPSDHPLSSEILSHLAGAMAARSQSAGSPDDLTESLLLYQRAAEHQQSDPKIRVEAAGKWGILARSQKHISTMPAYRMALSLLQLLLTMNPTLQTQHDYFTKAGSEITLDAASYAIEIDDLVEAVEMLEQGRALLWSEMRGLRTPADDVRAFDEALAEKFTENSRALENLATSTLASDVAPKVAPERQPDQYGTSMKARRNLIQEREQIITAIRASDTSLKHFLQPVPFSSLKIAADEGPVILINTSKFRSDALLVLRNHELPVLVPLATGFHEHMSTLSAALINARRTLRTDPQGYNRQLRSTLAELWEELVFPVFKKLDDFMVPHQTRIWWCPTSVLVTLPIHAARPIKTRNKGSISTDTFISSYTPTLSALIRARSPSLESTVSGERGFLVISLADPSLPTCASEVNAIQLVQPSVTTLSDSLATPEGVLAALQHHSWVHIVSHGVLEPERPFESSFNLFGGSQLTLLEIVKSRLPNAEFAFLSACHTAENTVGVGHDEILHLAAATQFCGFRSVIGTMWEMADDDGPDLAKEFYTAMFEDGAPDVGYKRAARALNRATKKLRKKDGMTLERWVNFIHIGA